MISRIPHRLKNFGLTIQGRGYAGLISEVTLPNFTIKTAEIRNGGMDAPIRDDMGQEVLDLKFKTEENIAALLRLWGLTNGSLVRLLFRGGASDGSTVKSFEIEARGKIFGAALGSVKSGEPNELEFDMNLHYCQLLENGSELICVDILNFIRRVGGRDQLEDLRNAIS